MNFIQKLVIQYLSDIADLFTENRKIYNHTSQGVWDSGHRNFRVIRVPMNPATALSFKLSFKSMRGFKVKLLREFKDCA